MNNQKRRSNGWALWDYRKKKYSYVFSNKFQVELCSPDFFKSDIKAGLCDILPVIIIEREKINPISLEYCALICGGLGEDCWEKEITFRSYNFLIAAKFSQDVADEMGGQVVSLEQSE